MKRLAVLAILFVLASCGRDVTPPDRAGHIVVYVHFEEGLPGKQVEILETGTTLVTNKDGLARFELSPGEYTVRAYDINRGGPCCGYVDEPATVTGGESVRVEIYDCVPCL